jgi:hypothetical protein
VATKLRHDQRTARNGLRGDVPPRDRNAPVEQLGDGDLRVGLPPCPGEYEQPAELDLRLDLGLAGLPEAELAAGQRILPGVRLGTPRPAQQLLYVTGRANAADYTAADFVGPRNRQESAGEGIKPQVGLSAGGAGGARTRDRQIMSPLL